MRRVRVRVGRETIEAILCSNLFTRSLGLIFRKRANALLVFRKPISKGKAKIWMPFMRYSIWIYFLSESNEVVDKQFALPISLFKPTTWRTYKPRTKTKTRIKAILEVHEDEKINNKIKIGDVVEW